MLRSLHLFLINYREWGSSLYAWKALVVAVLRHHVLGLHRVALEVHATALVGFAGHYGVIQGCVCSWWLLS